jgi:hypothetical protein
MGTDQKMSSDDWAHLAKPDMDLEDFKTALNFHHRVRVSGSSVAQKREVRESTKAFLNSFKTAPGLERSPSDRSD